MKNRKSLFTALVLCVLSAAVQSQTIFEAVRSGDLAKVKEITEKDPECMKARNARQSTPLHVAANLDNSEIANYCIDQGAELDALNGAFWTPLMFAGVKTAKILVERGADVNLRAPNGNTALLAALMTGRKEVAEYLLDQGAKPRPDLLFEIRCALKLGSVRYLEQAIQSGLDPQYEPASKSTLLHYAAEESSPEIIEKLFSLGLSAGKADIWGWTPLHKAAYYGNVSALDILIEKGANKNSRTVDGKTPFNLAVSAGKTEAVEFLKSQGADLSPQRFPRLKGDYLGMTKPGRTGEPFAPGIAVTQLGFHGSVAFSPDGNEAFWSGEGEIWGSKRVDGLWLPVEKKMSDADVPFVSPDGKRLFFLATQVTDGAQREVISVMDKTAEGWSEPVPLPDIINSIPGIHWQVSVDLKGNLYFGARQGGTVYSKIYCSEFKDGNYGDPVMLDIGLSGDAHSPYIFPDGRTLIFSSIDGMKIIFRKKDGTWTKERNIKEYVGEETACSMVTIDEKYLFYIKFAGDRHIPYWIDASFIKDLRNGALKEDQ